MKEEITKSTVLTHYDPKARTKMSTDASSFGLGSVLLQFKNDTWKPVAFASRSLTEKEKWYVQIEKETFAVMWSCEKFKDYILGKIVEIETDHKPLIPLLNSKRLDGLPPRVLQLRLRLDKFDFDIQHVPGKLLYVADTLSRAPLPGNKSEASELQEEVKTFTSHTVTNTQPQQRSLDVLHKKQVEDEICTKVMEYC